MVVEGWEVGCQSNTTLDNNSIIAIMHVVTTLLLAPDVSQERSIGLLVDTGEPTSVFFDDIGVLWDRIVI
jgi:hypothetical protein